MSALTDAAMGYLPEYVREADDGTLEALLDSACSQADVIVDWLSNPDDVADALVVPFNRIPWVAAIGGVDISRVPQAQQRAFIADDVTRYRGSEAAIRRRVGVTLTGAKSVEIVFTAATEVTVTTYASQTPDAAATTAAIRAEIPAWLLATIVTNAAGQSYSAMASDYATYGDMVTNGGTYGDLAQET